MYKIDSRDIFINGKNVFLKALNEADIINSNWYAWFNDELLCKTLQKHYFPNTISSQVKFWEENIKNTDKKIQLGICSVSDQVLIGVVSLNNIDYINRKCEFSILIGEKSYQNVVNFVEATKMTLNHAFNSLNMNKVYGGSISQDLVLLMTRTLGFKSEGIAREDIFKNGQYHDCFLYSIIKSEFKF
jgi:ribosomal-protein-alanine N-acetyltransferase